MACWPSVNCHRLRPFPVEQQQRVIFKSILVVFQVVARMHEVRIARTSLQKVLPKPSVGFTIIDLDAHQKFLVTLLLYHRRHTSH